MLNKTWIPDLSRHQQLHYKPVKYCTYWPVLGSFNNWNIIAFSHKATKIGSFEDIHQVVIDGISDKCTCCFNMVNLVPLIKNISQQWANT